MEIIGYVNGTEKNVIQLKHDNRTFTANISLILSDALIIGCYIGGDLPYLVYRKSSYGQHIINAFNDSRRYNPDGIFVE